jgi:hypothetical protein
MADIDLRNHEHNWLHILARKGKFKDQEEVTSVDRALGSIWELPEKEREKFIQEVQERKKKEVPKKKTPEEKLEEEGWVPELEKQAAESGGGWAAEEPPRGIRVEEREKEEVERKRQGGILSERDTSIESGPKDVNLRKKLLSGFQIEENIIISKQEEVPGAKGFRQDFDVKEGDKARFIIDEHILRVSEDVAQVFKSAVTFEEWEEAKKKVKSLSVHSDFRFVKEGEDYFFGFAVPEPGSTKDKNRLFHPEEQKMLVVQWKPHGHDLRWMEVGTGKAHVFEPGQPGAPSNLWAVIKRIDKGKVTFGQTKEHAIEMFISDTERIPEGRWLLTAVPLGGAKRTWFLSYPKQ